jgi:hypothetical protein
LEEEGANDIVGCTNCSLGGAVLLRCIRTRKTKENAVGGAKFIKLGIVKFSAIVTLECRNREIKLSMCIGMESKKCGINV